MRQLRSAAVFVSLAAIALATAAAAQNPVGTGWPTYGGDPGGSRYSTSTQINRTNLGHLRPVWTFHTHALDRPRPDLADASFEATPVLFGRNLLFTSPFDVIFSLDATTGAQQWSHDPKAAEQRPGNIVTSRGVATWSAPSSLRPTLSLQGPRLPRHHRRPPHRRRRRDRLHLR